MTLEASDPSQVAQNTTMSPLGPPPSVVLMPKHIHQQFETQREGQATKFHSKKNVIDNVLRNRNQKRRRTLRKEMGQAMTNLKKRQLRFQKYMENRTTPPKHKAFNKSKVNDVVSRLGDPVKGQCQIRRLSKSKSITEKIELKESAENVDERVFEMEKYRKRKKEKRRRERYKHRKHKKSRRERYDSIAV